ncbi:wiskott-Aldrich syndrome protein family member 2-like [Zingiber officinale]|uniref:wiskott-Aldrich syndrome protein family member 2-like n=1 Tax=Zingiber officinale TaxID=94328 RepID=UPI001C4AB7E1|nr:wiskott-Aldrich syndrome protein family member 2-like [Zingiber officinale]
MVPLAYPTPPPPVPTTYQAPLPSVPTAFAAPTPVAAVAPPPVPPPTVPPVAPTYADPAVPQMTPATVYTVAPGMPPPVYAAVPLVIPTPVVPPVSAAVPTHLTDIVAARARIPDLVESMKSRFTLFRGETDSSVAQHLSRDCSLNAQHMASGVSGHGGQPSQTGAFREGRRVKSSHRQQRTAPSAAVAYDMHGQEHSGALIVPQSFVPVPRYLTQGQD